MLHIKKNTLVLFILILLFSGYGLDVSLVAFAHDHEPVIGYVDNCPACQWEIQFKENDTYIQPILNAINNPLLLNLETPVYHTLQYNTLIYITSKSPRSPPFSYSGNNTD